MPEKIFFKNKLLNSKILLVVSLSIVVFFALNLSNEIISRRKLINEISKLKQQINGLESGNQELSGLISKLQSLGFVENEARTKLNLKKPGETIIIVSEQNNQDQTAENIFSEISPNMNDLKNNPYKWQVYFFGNN